MIVLVSAIYLLDQLWEAVVRNWETPEEGNSWVMQYALMCSNKPQESEWQSTLFLLAHWCGSGDRGLLFWAAAYLFSGAQISMVVALNWLPSWEQKKALIEAAFPFCSSFSEEQSRLAARKYARVVQKLGFPAKFLDFKIQNMVGSCDVRFPIRLEGLVLTHPQFSRYVEVRVTTPCNLEQCLCKLWRDSTPEAVQA